LSIRMRQFFDHYLKDEPAPIWLEKGIPAIDKGKKLGYELMEEKIINSLKVYSSKYFKLTFVILEKNYIISIFVELQRS